MNRAGKYSIASAIFGSFFGFVKKCMMKTVSAGPLPNHIAFIMDGNRRFARKRNLSEGAGHRFGLLALISQVKYCCELGVRYLTFYAFSIDNFRRRPDELQPFMDLLLETTEGIMKEENIINRYGVRIYFNGDLKLFSEPVRSAAERTMRATAQNSKTILTICIGYTSTNEIAQAVQESCEEKLQYEIRGPNFSSTNAGGELKVEKLIEVGDIEKKMYMAVAPDPDILIRTAGQTRLSNFLLWQSEHTYLSSPCVFWPEIGLRHLLWTILNFQRHHLYLEKRKKKLL